MRKAARRRPGGVGGIAPALEALGAAVRAAPGGLAAALSGAELPDAERVVVLWDEADLAAEPDAADALARLAEAWRPRASSSART